MDSPSDTPKPDTVVPYSTFIAVRQRRLRVTAELLRQNVAVDGGDPETPEPPTKDAEAVRIARAAAAPHSDR
jgi:hypothetical protein